MNEHRCSGVPDDASKDRKMKWGRRISSWIVSCLTAGFLLMPGISRSQDAGSGAELLTKVADIPMPGPAVRFDYQSLDVKTGRLYISHMNADQMVVFDTVKREVVANLDGFKRVHGVWAVSELARVYASVTGEHAVAVVDSETLHTLTKVGPITYPDGLAYAPKAKRVFVSDEHGNADAVIDATNNTLVASIPLGGGAGNTVYDPNSGHILVAVHSVNELVAIDPASAKIIGRYSLPGIKNPHGIALDTTNRLAFVAGEENHSLGVVDLTSMKLLSTHQVGEDPDVLAFDPGLHRLYVSAESGTVSVFEENGRDLKMLGQFVMPHAHTVSVDPKTHLVYFPLENVNGRPLLRIMKPTQPRIGLSSSASKDPAGTPTPQVLFVCEHGNVKSLMAANYFNQLAQERGLPFRAVSRGSAPNSTTVPPEIVQGLRGDGFDVSAFHPSAISASDVSASQRVITIGTSLPPDAQTAQLKLEQWNDVPPANVDYGESRDSLKSHIKDLVEQLAAFRQQHQ